MKKKNLRKAAIATMVSGLINLFIYACVYTQYECSNIVNYLPVLSVILIGCGFILELLAERED